jgi:hypothetical protein
MDLFKAIQITQLIVNIASVIGIPIAIYVYWSNKVIERKQKEYETYNAIDEKYYEYIRLCLQFPELDMFYIPLSKKIKLTPEQSIQRLALFEILISLLERAYIMYANQSTQIKLIQWEGWKSYIQDWCQRKDFRDLWEELGPGYYDERFTKYVDNVIKNST